MGNLLDEDGDEGEGQQDLQDTEDLCSGLHQSQEGLFDGLSEVLVQLSSIQQGLLLLLLQKVTLELHWASGPTAGGARASDLNHQLGAELPGQEVHRHVELIEQLTKVSLHRNLVPAPRGHDCRRERRGRPSALTSVCRTFLLRSRVSHVSFNSSFVSIHRTSGLFFSAVLEPEPHHLSEYHMDVQSVIFYETV